ncbi:hypothetical protein [Aminobacter sp. AP02]|uniref:dCTP deaminase domain-containing protein n=1 Tax=Aminobacter sp. AP02 TaxID=2135737 RepID=UPI000D6D4D29|nr:hypothetical protein [Aminobacter sp. AP02]PWK64643.1 deoxycytidine triphosphate deaminase [Aminobacter sp. AP02]
MTLLAAEALDPKRFFEEGSNPGLQGSSFDLTVGSIYDHEGKKVTGPFTLKPNHMVQVASAEVFSLPDNVTGHVTYKTTLTSKGIWALTVGIVDPGWRGPISTTLLNYSRVDHGISEGDAFLRVSFFEHDPVPSDKMRKAPSCAQYMRGVQTAAATIFPQTFLDTSKIADQAGTTAMERLRNRAFGWAAAMAVLFAVVQLVTSYLQPSVVLEGGKADKEEVTRLAAELNSVKERLSMLERESSTSSPSQLDNREPGEQTQVPSKQPIPVMPEKAAAENPVPGPKGEATSN